MNTKSKNDLAGWDYLGEFYKHDGNVSYREIGEKFGKSASNVGACMLRLPRQKFSELKQTDNNLLPNNDYKQ